MKLKTSKAFESESDSDAPPATKNIKTFQRNPQSRPKPSITQIPTQTRLETQQEIEHDYDAFHTARASLTHTTKSAATQEPRYIQNIIQASLQRKTDRLQVQKNKLQKTRDDEGVEFEGKEEFVTGAYKQALTDQNVANESASVVSGAVGNGGFGGGLYKRKDEVILTDVDIKRINSTLHAPKTEDAVIAKNDNGVVLNSLDEIVDKRQLLNAGLNVTVKPKQDQTKPQPRQQPTKPYQRQERRYDDRRPQNIIRLASQRQPEPKKEVIEAHSRTSTDKVVLSARERYLARKKEQQSDQSESG